MSKTIAFVGSAVLFAGVLSACGEYQGCVPVDDALILPQAQETRKPSGTKTSRGNSWSKPSKAKTAKAKTGHGKGLHWDEEDCEWDDD